jgi:hypothetical protein
MGAGGELQPEAVLGAALERGVANVYEINDNHGDDFRFAPATDGDGWLCTGLDPPSPQATDRSREVSVALAAVKSTDVLVIGADPAAVPAGTSLAPIGPARRGVWYSLGFILRGAAARLLHVQTTEIDVGLRAVRRDGILTAQVFLSDNLANGAGYCTHLGQPEVFQQLLDEAAAWTRELENHTNAGEKCDSACYDCLKDYRNMHFHGLLDWRLGADLVDILRHDYDPSRRWAVHGTGIVRDWASQFMGFEFEDLAGVPAATDSRIYLIGVHPLSERDVAYASEEVAEADAEARSALGITDDEPGVVLQNYFDLLRRPGWAYSELWKT